MRDRLVSFVLDNGLSPFGDSKSLSVGSDSVFKTRDAKAVFSKTLTKLSSDFVFRQSSSLWSFFVFGSDPLVVRARQEFFSSLSVRDSKSVFSSLSVPRRSWRPKYDIIAVTEDESTFVELQKLGCTSQLLVSENDLLDLERYDIVQVVDCDDFRLLLERLPQSVFVNGLEDVYLERFLEDLSGWVDNLRLLSKSAVSSSVMRIVDELLPLASLMQRNVNEILSESKVEAILEDINESIADKIKEMTISGDSLMLMLGQGKMPKPIVEIVQSAVASSGVSEHIFNLQVPVTIDYDELEAQIKRQSASEFTNLAEEVKRSAEQLKRIPELLSLLSAELLVEDFCCGVVSKCSGEGFLFPSLSDNFHISGAKNLFLSKPQPVTFQLDGFSRCSILTGANSGGKTTLLEHLIQVVSLFHLGLPVFGEVHAPLFTEVYYFAKNKGSASKGAFETLLTQMSKIAPGSKTLILADEIEAVTEPGVAGKIIAATADFFIRKGCFSVFATHLGHEIRHVLPNKARIDGIEAKGLDENFELIVDHSPVMGRLAHSTPELIIRRMAMANDSEYFSHLQSAVEKPDNPKPQFGFS